MSSLTLRETTKKRIKAAAAALKADGLDLTLDRSKLELLLKFDLKIARETNSNRLLQLLAEETRQILEADRCTVFLYNRNTDELWSKVAQGLKTVTLWVPKDKGIVGHAFINRETLNVKNASDDQRFSNRFDHVTGYKTKTVLATPMIDSRGENVLGAFEALNKKEGAFSKKDEILLQLLARHAATAVENAQLYEDLRLAQRETIFRLALLAEHRDQKDTAAHLRRMCTYSGLIAQAMELPTEYVETIQLVAALHDIGKVAIPDAILLKSQKLNEAEIGAIEYRLSWWVEKLRMTDAPDGRVQEVAGFLDEIRQANRPSTTEMPKELIDRILFIASQKMVDRDHQEKSMLTTEEVRKLTIKRGNLTPEERTEVEKHTSYGASVLAQADSRLMQMGEQIALTHHEKFDGSGYPRGLRGEQIPLEGRIVALADVFDALTSSRAYKNGWSLDETVAYLQRESGKHFDPKVVRAFLKTLPKIREFLGRANH